MTNDPASQPPDTLRELMLVEYKTLRDETLKRMDHRISLLMSSLTVTGAILGIGIERSSGPLLLVIPTVSVLFGLLVIYHTKAIADIARYLHRNIERPLDVWYPGSFGWHTRPDSRRRFKRIFSVFHLPIMLTVLVPSLSALTLAWQFRGSVTVTVPLAIMDVALLTFYVTEYFRHTARPLLPADSST